ncbi:hypothetical protein P7K49_032218 [Saguinus oedipus]|uniref:Uncharacterized protein n=1 Tax=Saguinus oedipus TaxID=9490 RepID=A0ABQ9TXL7_SAGOE|nr:hypothetical protein P7K49_032218 [Saguinus oedipus]
MSADILQPAENADVEPCHTSHSQSQLSQKATPKADHAISAETLSSKRFPVLSSLSSPNSIPKRSLRVISPRDFILNQKLPSLEPRKSGQQSSSHVLSCVQLMRLVGQPLPPGCHGNDQAAGPLKTEKNSTWKTTHSTLACRLTQLSSQGEGSAARQRSINKPQWEEQADLTVLWAWDQGQLCKAADVNPGDAINWVSTKSLKVKTRRICIHCLIHSLKDLCQERLDDTEVKGKRGSQRSITCLIDLANANERNKSRHIISKHCRAVNTEGLVWFTGEEESLCSSQPSQGFQMLKQIYPKSLGLEGVNKWRGGNCWRKYEREAKESEADEMPCKKQSQVEISVTALGLKAEESQALGTPRNMLLGSEWSNGVDGIPGPGMTRLLGHEVPEASSGIWDS